MVHTFVEDEIVNRQNYLQILKNYFYPIMQRTRINNKMIFQQDGASFHFSTEVCTWFNEEFNGMSISRGAPISWAACSRDLTSLDLFSFYGTTLKQNKGQRYCRFKGKD